MKIVAKQIQEARSRKVPLLPAGKVHLKLATQLAHRAFAHPMHFPALLHRRLNFAGRGVLDIELRDQGRQLFTPTDHRFEPPALKAPDVSHTCVACSNATSLRLCGRPWVGRQYATPVGFPGRFAHKWLRPNNFATSSSTVF